MATAEFNTGILEAGLIPLPMQGSLPHPITVLQHRHLTTRHWFYMGDSQQLNGGMFRFDNYLALSPEFIPNVQSIWHHEVVGIPMYAVT
ncbi:UNVERIFIED_CONTAM: hypothetical protein Sindi_3101500, partial [Sesamum indicum]